MALSEDERKEAEEVFLQELNEEHEDKIAALERRHERLRAKKEARSQREKNIYLEELRDKVRESFYTEKGYRRYVDSRGRELWLAPEEYEWRMRHRRRRRKRRFRLANAQRYQMVLIYFGILLLAIALGIAVAK